MFLTLFGLIWILSDKFFLPHEDKEGFGRGAFEKKKVPNCQKHRGLPFRTLLGLFIPLWNVDKPAMFVIAIFVWFIGAPSVHHLSSFYLSIVLSFHLSVFFVFLSFCLFIFRVFRISFFSSFCLIVFLSKLFLVHFNS